MIKIMVDNKNCEPIRKHKWDAGYDLVSNNETFTIKPNDKVKVYTGVKIEIPPRHMGLVVPRSGLGSKFRIGLANTLGVIDTEYRGEIIVNLVNDGNENLEVKKYDRFCQLIILPVLIDNLRIVDCISGTGRGENGFGSTGTNIEDKNFEKSTEILLENNKPSLLGMKLDDYAKLNASGMLHEIYPEATGVYNKDCLGK